MARKKKTAGTSTSGKSPGPEWQGGMVQLNGYVSDRGDPYRPAVICWLGPDGAMLGAQVGPPEDMRSVAVASLRDTIESPKGGRSRPPASLRIASPELAEVLRVAFPSIEVICAPTPEIDAFLAHMSAELDREFNEDRLTFGMPDVEPEALAALFRAAARLYRIQPWKIVPDDEGVLSVTCEALGLHGVAIAVIGQLGEHFGIVVFADDDDFYDYVDALEQLSRGHDEAIPRHMALNYESRDTLAKELVDAVEQNGWEIAGPKAYPWLWVFNDGAMRPPTAREVTQSEAIALALVEFLADKKALAKAFDGVKPLLRTVTVDTHAGSFEVEVGAPYEPPPVGFKPGILGDLAALLVENEVIDFDRRVALEDQLLDQFRASPEAKGVEDTQVISIILDLLANYLEATIATARAADLRELLLDVVPRKVSVPPSEARSIIEPLRAFFQFLKREHGLSTADSCLEELGEDGVGRLESALGDSSKFGMAKSFFTAGVDAGFDMETQEGIDAWLRASQGFLPGDVNFPGFGLSAPGAAKGKKRKTSKKAKKKRKKAGKNKGKKAGKKKRSR